MEFKSNSAGQGLEWIQQSMDESKGNRLNFFFAFIIYLIASVLIGLIPYLGTIIVAIIEAIFAAGVFVICKKLMQKKPFDMVDLFVGITDKKIFKSLLPLYGLYALLGLSTLLMNILIANKQVPSWGFVPFSVVLGLVKFTFLNLTVFMKTEFPDLSLVDAVDLNVRVVRKNLLALVFLGFLVVTMVFFSTLLLIIPLFFVLPMIFMTGYFCYRGCVDTGSADTVAVEAPTPEDSTDA